MTDIGGGTSFISHMFFHQKPLLGGTGLGTNIRHQKIRGGTGLGAQGRHQKSTKVPGWNPLGVTKSFGGTGLGRTRRHQNSQSYSSDGAVGKKWAASGQDQSMWSMTMPKASASKLIGRVNLEPFWCHSAILVPFWCHSVLKTYFGDFWCRYRARFLS